MIMIRQYYKSKGLQYIFPVLSVSLFALTVYANTQRLPFDTESKLWTGQFSLAGPLDNSSPSLKIVDNDAKGGTYAISNFIPIPPKRDYEITASCKTNGKVTSESIIYVRIFDISGKLLTQYSSNGTTSINWTNLFCSVPSTILPESATSFRIILQAARGAAKETGTAWFDDIRITSMKTFQPPQNCIEVSDLFIKSLPSFMPVKFDGKKYTTLEVSWRNFHKLSSLALKNNGGNMKKLKVSYWNDKKQKWYPAGSYIPRTIKETGYVTVRLDKIHETRRLLINFNNPSKISNLKLYTIPKIEENWKASWIWFTKKRVEHINRFFRKTFTVVDKVKKAYFQGTSDDSAIFFINGKRIISNSAWNVPVQCEVSKFLLQGKNVITVDVHQNRYAAGILAEIDINYKSGRSQKVITNESWKSTDKPEKGWRVQGFDDSSWVKSKLLGVPPAGAWSVIPYNNNSIKKQIILENTPLPKKLRAGQTISAKFELKIARDINKKLPVYFCMSRNNKDFIRKKVNDINGILLNNLSGKAQLNINFDLNSALYPGKYDFSLHIPYCSVVKSGKEWKQTVFIENTRKPQPLKTEVKKIHGIPVMHINGVPQWSMFYTTTPRYNLEQVNHQAFAKNGIKLVHCYVNPKSPQEDEYDFTDIDRTVLEIIENNPNALIIMKPGFRDCVPQWFLTKYPEEVVVLDAGEKLLKPSLSSLKWRKVAGNMLKNMIRHINNSPYSDKVIGYFVREGEEGQWMHYWGGSDLDKDNILSDYSQPMKTYFRAWLKNKYINVEALRKAWHDNKVTFDTLKIPSKKERLAPQNGVFRDPAKNRRAIDYAEALSDVICDGIIYYAKIVKEETHNKALMLAFFGHIIDLGGFFLGEQVGYLKQRRVINCPDVDYLAGPISYAKAFRDIGGVASFDYPAPACLRLQNKIWLNEDDVRTHLVKPAGYAYSVRTPKQTNEVLAREFAKALCAGAGLYWLNLSAGKRYWFDDKQTSLTIGKLNKIAQKAVKDNLSSVSEIAVIMSDKSLLYMRSRKPKSKKDGIVQQSIIYQREQIARLGAPFDEYLLDDFLDPTMPDYKLYIFLNAFYMTDKERKAIVSKLKKENSSAIWFYAPGYITEKGLSLAAMSKLTGIKFDKSSKRDDSKIKLVSSNSLLSGYRKTIGMPSGNTLKPLFFTTDNSVEVIGRLKSNNKAAFVVGKNSGFTSYYCSAPVIPAELLRGIAKKSGVHIYTRQNDAIYACKDYLAIHTSKKAGSREIILPKPCVMVQLYPEYKKYSKKRKFSFKSKSPQTRIFKINY